MKLYLSNRKLKLSLKNIVERFPENSTSQNLFEKFES